MPKQPDGTYVLPRDWEQDAANGIGIEPDLHMEVDTDLGQALTDSLDRQGRGSMKADLAVGNFKLTQVAAGANAADGVNIAQVQNEVYQTATETGVANAYVIALTPPITAYTTGLTVKFVATEANTGASTLQVNGLTPAPALQWHGKDLVANTITAGAVVEAIYSGSVFELLNPPEVLPAQYGGTGTTTGLPSVGTSVGDLVELVDVGGNPGWPAVDGSQLTNVYGSNGVKVYTASGTFTKATDIPAGVTYVDVEVIGGGGGGGGVGATGAGEGAAGSGGGAGGYARKLLQVSALGATETVTVGTGGAGGAVGFNQGSTGGTSSFGALVSATGGVGGFSTLLYPSAAGGGGSGANGDVNATGDGGEFGAIVTASNYSIGGNGGSSHLGGGGVSGSSGTATTGTAGTTGGGGSGAYSGASQAGAVGGAGGDGIVIVRW